MFSSCASPKYQRCYKLQGVSCTSKAAPSQLMFCACFRYIWSHPIKCHACHRICTLPAKKTQPIRRTEVLCLQQKTTHLWKTTSRYAKVSVRYEKCRDATPATGNEIRPGLKISKVTRFAEQPIVTATKHSRAHLRSKRLRTQAQSREHTLNPDNPE